MTTDICSGKSITSVLNSAAHIAHDRFAKGGFHLQVNVTSAELLRQAQQCPEEHEDLLIRISGYSDYFTRLDTQLQDALIART